MLRATSEYPRQRLGAVRTRSRDDDATFQMDEELFTAEEDARSTLTGSSEDATSATTPGVRGHRRNWSFGSFTGALSTSPVFCSSASSSDLEPQLSSILVNSDENLPAFFCSMRQRNTPQSEAQEMETSVMVHTTGYQH